MDQQAIYLKGIIIGMCTALNLSVPELELKPLIVPELKVTLPEPIAVVNAKVVPQLTPEQIVVKNIVNKAKADKVFLNDLIRENAEGIIEKPCTKGWHWVPIENFGKNNANPGKLDYMCKNCLSEYQNNLRKGSNKVLRANKFFKPHKPNPKVAICPNCHIEQSVKDFVGTICRDCKSKQDKNVLQQAMNGDLQVQEALQ